MNYSVNLNYDHVISTKKKSDMMTIHIGLKYL